MKPTRPSGSLGACKPTSWARRAIVNTTAAVAAAASRAGSPDRKSAAGKGGAVAAAKPIQTTADIAIQSAKKSYPATLHRRGDF